MNPNKEEVTPDSIDTPDSFVDSSVAKNNDKNTARDRLANIHHQVALDELSDDGADYEEQEVADDFEEPEISKDELNKKTTKHKIKVNGKEMEMTTEELITRASKVEAADEYLRRAKELTELEVYQPEEQPSQWDVDQQINSDNEDYELVRAIQMGSEDEAVAAIRKIKGPKQQSFNTNDMFQAFDNRQRLQNAQQQFKKEFNDIVDDPYLMHLAIQQDTKLMNEGDSRSYEERFTEVGTSIRKWIADKAGANPGKMSISETKEARKQNAPSSLRKASSGRSSASSEAVSGDEDEHQEIIRAMAEKRGKRFY